MGKAIKHLRLFLKDSIRRKIISPIDLTEYKVFEEVADATYLTSYEIETIYKLDLSLNPQLETAKDLLILGCLTGLRISDFSSIKPEDIRNGKLHQATKIRSLGSNTTSCHGARNTYHKV